MLLAAQVWTYWIGVVLFLAAVLTTVALVVRYVVQVEAPRYPKRGQPVVEAKPSKK